MPTIANQSGTASEETQLPSFLEVIGKLRSENVHSSILAWLFNSSADHDLGTQPLCDLLKLLVEKAGNVREFPKSLLNSNIINDLTIHSVLTEEKMFGGGGLFDIFIEFSIGTSEYRLILENKIYSKEGKQQTEKYYKSEVKRRKKEASDNSESIFVFLTPDGHKAKCDAFVNISYQDIFDKVLRGVPERTRDDRTRFLMEEYQRAFSPAVNSTSPVLRRPLAV